MARPRRGGPSSLPFGVPRGGSTGGRLAGLPRTPPAGAGRIGTPRIPVGPPPTASRPSAAPPKPSLSAGARKYASLSPSAKKNVRQLVSMGLLKLDEDELEGLDYVLPEAEKRDRPPTVLKGIFRALGVTENIGAGFVKGAHEELKEHDTGFGGQAKRLGREALKGIPGGFALERELPKPKKNEHFLPPWTYAQAVGKGFSEVPSAVKEGYTYENLLKENNNPDSFLFRHARPIALSMAIGWDPTTYLGLGTTTAGKTIAVHQLDELFDISAREAVQKIESGAINPRTGQRYLPHEWGEATYHTHVEAGRPQSLGDMLQDMQKGPLRGKARGGVRIAGAPLPGTERAGYALARGTQRTRAAVRQKFRPYEEYTEHLIPDGAAKHIVDDMLRSSALVRLQRIRDAGRIPQEYMEELPGILLRETHVTDPATGVSAKIKLTDAFESYDEIAAMRGLPEDQMSATQKVLSDRIRVANEGAIRRRMRTSPKDRELQTRLQNDLEDLNAKYDPFQASILFQSKIQGDIAWRELKKDLLGDPRFSYLLETETRAGKEVAKAEGRERHPRYGYTVVTQGNKRYAVVEGVGDAINVMDNPAWRRDNLEKGLQFLNKPQDWWKVYATQPNPSYHTMNLVGAVWNNALMGNITGMDYVRAWDTLMASRIEGAAQRGQKARLAQVGRVGPAIAHAVTRPLGLPPVRAASTEEARELVKAAQRHGGLGRSSQIFAESEGFGRGPAAEQVFGGVTAPTPQTAKAMGFGPKGVGPKAMLERITKPADLAGKKRAGVRVAGRRARQAAAVGGVPFTGGLSAMALAPEAAKVGKHIGGTIEDWVRLTPFQKISTDKALRQYKEQMIEAFGPVTVPGMKHPGFTKEMQESMYEIGAAMTRHFQFDYTHLTEFERRYAKTVFPFWTFFSRNIALQAAQVAKKPGQFAMTEDVMNFIDQEGVPDGPYKSVLPLYFDQLSAFQIPVPDGVRDKLGIAKGQPIYLNPKLPFASLNLIPNLWIPFTDDSPTSSWNKWNRAFSPIFAQWGPYSTFGAKTIFESIIGKNLGLAKPIDYQRATSNDFRQSTLPAPSWVKFLPDALTKHFGVYTDKRRGETRMPATSAYFLDTMTNPFISNYGDVLANPGKDPDKEGKINADRISWLTGIRIMPADVGALGRAYAYGIKNELEAKKSEKNERGQELSEEDEDLLDDIREAIDSFEYSRETRDIELYGEPED